MNFKINEQKFKIRNCREEDYTFVYNLLKNNMYGSFIKHWGGWDPKSFRKNFNKKEIKIIEFRERRVGFSHLKIKENFSFVDNVQISKSMQGKGLGTFLMDLMEKETRKKGLKKIRLKVFKDNLARKLYLKLGYKQIKAEGSAVILEKKLK